MGVIGETFTNKRNGFTGVVIDDSNGLVTISDVESNEKTFTKEMFEKWFIPYKPKTQRVRQQIYNRELNGSKTLNRFLTIFKSCAKGMEYTIRFNPKYHYCTVSVNRRNAFKIVYSKYKISVFANKKSLSPSVNKQETEELPNTWNCALRSKFVFNDLDDNLMKMLIVDGIYFIKNL